MQIFLLILGIVQGIMTAIKLYNLIREILGMYRAGEKVEMKKKFAEKFAVVKSLIDKLPPGARKYFQDKFAASLEESKVVSTKTKSSYSFSSLDTLICEMKEECQKQVVSLKK